MPAANPRITITLSPEVRALLGRVSSLTGNSQSSIVGGILQTSVPVFERLIAVLEAAREAQGKVNDEVLSSLAVAQGKVESQFGLALETLDDGFRPILQAAEKVQRRAPGAGGTRRLPPMSNRGVTPHPKVKKSQIKGGRS